LNTDYRIQLNFLPLTDCGGLIGIYRRIAEVEEKRPSDDCSLHSLPIESDDEGRANYWVSFSRIDGFEFAEVGLFANNNLTIQALSESLKAAAISGLNADQYIEPRSSFSTSLSLVMEKHLEGEERLVIEPYLLRPINKFGFLVDFHFGKSPDVPFSRRVQQLSLSLDANYRRNLDCYANRLSKITTFLKKRSVFFSSLVHPNSSTSISIEQDFSNLPANRLLEKTYIHGSEKPSRSQFNGLRQNGPLKPLESVPTVLFCFREQDRQAARRLAMALKGSTKSDKLGFPGFSALFKSEIEISSNPFILPDLERHSFTRALERVKEDRRTAPATIPLLILPEGDDNGYHEHKAQFAHDGIASQVCTLPVILDDYALKWSIANIALQLFCKAGGQPWKVRPTSKKTLIVGISQSHKMIEVSGKKSIEKYFAFSVMSDNSGLFQELHVLGEALQEVDYLAQLKKNLSQTLSSAKSSYERVVIHTSFRLKRKEIDAINATVKLALKDVQGKCEFAVLRVNHKSRFFGFNRSVNSLVPYEATSVRLGGGQYLIWFEGIFPDKPTVNKAYPGPTLVEFMRLNEDSEQGVDSLLQDLVNLSGANWRGFNAKSAPVSVFYCHLVADLVHDFHRQGLPLPKIVDLRPWFL
jgi:hypothetical protein